MRRKQVSFSSLQTATKLVITIVVVNKIIRDFDLGFKFLNTDLVIGKASQIGNVLVMSAVSASCRRLCDCCELLMILNQ